jgi:hypothetical protein
MNDVECARKSTYIPELGGQKMQNVQSQTSSHSLEGLCGVGASVLEVEENLGRFVTFEPAHRVSHAQEQLSNSWHAPPFHPVLFSRCVRLGVGGSARKLDHVVHLDSRHGGRQADRSQGCESSELHHLDKG